MSSRFLSEREKQGTEEAGDPSLLIVGCGDLGYRVGELLQHRGWRISAVSRHPPDPPDSFGWYVADYTRPGSLTFAASLRPDFVLAIFKPSAPDIEGYRKGFAEAAGNLLQGLGTHLVRRLLMISSTRVYAESSGNLVDESGELSSTDQRALAIIDAEGQFLDAAQPATVVRCGGIYGDPDSRLVSRVAEGRISPALPIRYTNRIHRDDCTGFLAHLLLLAQNNAGLEEIYNAVDNEPAPAHEVETWLAGTLGITATAGHAVANPAATTNKRCRNALLQASGYELLYPDYRAGYRQVLAADKAVSD